MKGVNKSILFGGLMCLAESDQVHGYQNLYPRFPAIKPSFKPSAESEEGKNRIRLAEEKRLRKNAKRLANKQRG